MDAFSKELAGLLCSDNQAARVLTNKIVPKIVETITARLDEENPAEGCILLLDALSSWAAGYLSGAFEVGRLSEKECFLYDQVKHNNPEFLTMLSDSFPSKEREEKFMAMYKDWKKN